MVSLFNQPAFFDIFGIFAFTFISVFSIWALKTKNSFPKWALIILLIIGMIGFLIDSFTVYNAYLSKCLF